MEEIRDNKIVCQNGNFISQSKAEFNFASQTIHYGLGAFEGIRSYETANGIKIFKAKEHFERLKLSCQKINLPFNWDIKALIKDTYTLLEKNNLKNAYIRPIVYTGSGMDMVTSTEAHLVIMAWEWNSFYGDDLLKSCISSFEKPNPNSAPLDVKITGNYLNSVLAITEAKNKGFDEAILMDMHGYVAESTSANIFIERDGKLYTPKIGNIMPGITRGIVMQIAKQLDFEVIEKNITQQDLIHADSAFLCGTAVEIIGIKSVDDTVFPFSFSESIGSTIQRVYKSLVLDKLSFEVII
jgi:branched-chain amino acid aminotransferase